MKYFLAMIYADDYQMVCVWASCCICWSLYIYIYNTCMCVGAAISTLADLHSGQRQLFWGPMWICISACEYLVIWCDKTTFHKLNDPTTCVYIYTHTHTHTHTTCFSHTGPSSGIYDDMYKLLQYIEHLMAHKTRESESPIFKKTMMDSC
jgi:hypothetical protein